MNRLVCVTSDDFDNWMIQGSPNDDLMDVASIFGPGVYEHINGSWHPRDIEYPTDSDVSTLLCLRDSEVLPEYTKTALARVLNTCVYYTQSAAKSADQWEKLQLKSGASPDVVDFISLFRYYEGEQIVPRIIHKYTRGFCYYFANLLKTAMKRGHLAECVNIGHVVWEDVDGKHYDINGLYTCATLVSYDFDENVYRHTTR